MAKPKTQKEILKYKINCDINRLFLEDFTNPIKTEFKTTHYDIYEFSINSGETFYVEFRPIVITPRRICL
jgi:hypothetical protein